MVVLFRWTYIPCIFSMLGSIFMVASGVYTTNFVNGVDNSVFKVIYPIGLFLCR